MVKEKSQPDRSSWTVDYIHNYLRFGSTIEGFFCEVARRENSTMQQIVKLAQRLCAYAF